MNVRRTARTVYVAKLETPSFMFEAYGQTEAEARRALKTTILTHIRQTGADREYFLDDEADWQCQPYVTGFGYRDGERV